MTKGDTFTYKGKLYQFERYFQYSPLKDGKEQPVLISAHRWIKSTQKFSGSALLVAKASDVEAGV